MLTLARANLDTSGGTSEAGNSLRTEDCGSVRRWRPYVVFLLVIAAATFVFRVMTFGDMEPRVDQAFFAWWVQGLGASDHLLPRPDSGEPIFDALARDETGFVTQLFRPIYNSTTEVFKLVPLLSTYAVTLVFGGSFAVQVAVGIAAGTAVLLVLGFYPLWRDRSAFPVGACGDDALVGGLAAAIGALSLYLHVFSSLGAHNFGILFLAVGVAVGWRVLPRLLERNDVRGCARPFLVLFLATGLAFYSYKTNVFLLPVAIGLFVVFYPAVGWRRKFLVLSVYGLFCLILVSPIFLFFAVDAAKPGFAKDDFSLEAVLNSYIPGGSLLGLKLLAGRTVDWFRTGGHLFSWPGLVAGLGGLGWMAADRRASLPFWLVIAHLVAWCIVPLFAETGLRTYPYVLPFLALGAAFLLVRSFRMAGGDRDRSCRRVRWAAFAAVAGLLLIHMGFQLPGFVAKRNLAAAYPDVWEFYMTGQGELRPMVSEIEGILPPGAVLMTWGYGLQYVFRDLKSPETKVWVPPALNALALRYRAGLLEGYMKRRRLSLAPESPIFLLVDPVIDRVDKDRLRQALGGVLGEAGYGLAERVELSEIRSWTFTSFWPRRAVLYRVRPVGG